MHTKRFWPLLGLALVLATPLKADDVCSAEEHRAGNAALTKAQSAEKSGDLKGALESAYQALNCGDYKTARALQLRVSKKLGQQAETDGKYALAFDYFVAGEWLEDARRVGLKQLAAEPGNFNLASSLKAFMQNHEFADGTKQILAHSRQQAQRLLAEEEKNFSIRTPQQQLLRDAREWLELAGDPITPVQQKALQRADTYFALDYVYALQQAIQYYELADQANKTAAVHTKARQLADNLAGGENWAAAVDLYVLAGDDQKAEELSLKRQADAASNEEARKKKFDEEQDDLEKELDFD